MRWKYMIVVLVAAAAFGFDERFDGPVINYRKAKANQNPVGQLQESLATGQVALSRGEDGTGLEALLAALKVPVASQVLVFSKTSLQTDYISPRSPRAIYFNDDVYVGTVKGSPILEISAQDGDLGAVFYTYDHRRKDGAVLKREVDTCFRCHAPRQTEGAPAHVVRSVYPDKQGFPMLRNGSFFTDDKSPFEKRWGGWYVTGKYPNMTHMGNSIGHEDEKSKEIRFKSDTSGGRDSLSTFIDPSRYLTDTSDVVALMVLEHQAHLHNVITLAGYQTRLALNDEKVMDGALNRSTNNNSALTKRRIEHYGDLLVKALIFSYEAKLPAPLTKSTVYTQAFTQLGGKRDKKGRSLRDFDLKTRLFAYPCSFLIQSEGFYALPKPLKDYVYQRLHGGLTGDDMSDMFMSLNAKGSKAVLEILRDTQKDLPNYWYED